jgi:hypothetical protein
MQLLVAEAQQKGLWNQLSKHHNSWIEKSITSLLNLKDQVQSPIKMTEGCLKIP